MKKSLLSAIVLSGVFAFGQNPANLDTNFGSGGKVFTDFNNHSEVGNAMVLQPDGKIILAGTGIVTVANGYDFCVARYNTDGTLDESFGTNGKANFEITNYNNSLKRDYATGLVLQSDGKIIISGYCPDGNFSSADNEFAVIRLNSNGTLDTNYATNGILRFGFGSAHAEAHALAIQPDNKIIVAGYSITTSSNYDFAIARVNTDGTLDTDFSNDGKTVINLDEYDKANTIAIQSDGKIIVAGDADGQLGLIRLTEFGNLDSTFGTNGKLITNIEGGGEEILAIKMIEDGKILCAGTRYTNQSNFLAIRYNANGTLDTTFGTNGYTTVDLDNESQDTAKSIAVQNDGKFIIVGDTYTDGAYYFALTRFNANGTLDTTFSGDGVQLTTMNGADANAICIQTDGKIVVGGGNFLSGGNTGNYALARYLGDNSLSVDELDANSIVQIYPNPAKNSIYLNLVNNATATTAYSIYDTTGKKIKEGTIENHENAINIESLPRGIYLVQVNQMSAKFVKE